MQTYKRWIAVVLLISLFSKTTCADTLSSQSKSSSTDSANATLSLYLNSAPLDLNLSQLEYPYPVNYFETQLNGAPVKMAFMDVKPQGKELGTVVLFHGKNFASDYWGSTIKDLSRAGYRVIAPDQVGFGKSSKPEVEYHFDDLCKNTFKLLQHLNVRKVNVIANSMGGMVAVRFVRLYPDLAQKLILENPIGLEDYSKAIPPQSNDVLLKLEMAQTEDSYRKFMHSYFPNWQPEFETFVENYVRIKNGPDYKRFSETSVRTFQMIAERPVVSDLPLIQQPTLLIIGQLDHTVFGRRFAPADAIKSMGDFVQLGKTAASIIPQATLEPIPNVGHVPHLEVHDLFMEKTLQFLK